jgi:hypothetical protein
VNIFYENFNKDSVKMRQKTSTKDKSNADQNQKSIEDDLKWVEENVPATLVETYAFQFRLELITFKITFY